MSKNQFLILPGEVAYSTDLSDFEKLLYAEILKLSNQEGYAFAKNEYYVNLLNKSMRTVQRSVKKLSDLDYIKVVSGHNQRRRIYPQVKIGSYTPKSKQKTKANTENYSNGKSYSKKKPKYFKPAENYDYSESEMSLEEQILQERLRQIENEELNN